LFSFHDEGKVVKIEKVCDKKRRNFFLFEKIFLEEKNLSFFLEFFLVKKYFSSFFGL